MKKIFYRIQIIQSSFWFVPLLLTVAGVILAIGLVYLDAQIDFSDSRVFQHIFTESASSARTVLSVIAGAMIGIAGTVFSITLVVLTLASSQFGPRLLRNFMYDRLNQSVLGLYVSTYIYCLIVLNSVKDNDHFSFIPSLSILFAILLTIICIVFLILYIHNVSMSIQPSRVISTIGTELKKVIETSFSNNKLLDGAKDYETAVAKIKDQLSIKSNIKSVTHGYLQYIDIEPLLDLSVQDNLLIHIKFKPGEYVINGATIAETYCATEIEESTVKAIRKNFVTANSRTAFQDSEFAIDQIVEIACKALSPGINDPFTAIICIDYLSSVICDFTNVVFPPKFVEDSNQVVRIIKRPLTFEAMLNSAFNQIRQFGAQSPAVIIRLTDALATILEFAKNDEHVEVVRTHLNKVFETGKMSFENTQDYADLRERFEDILFFENKEPSSAD